MIEVICFGKIKEKYLNDMINDYFKRINKYHKILITELSDSNDIKKEEELLLKKLDRKSYIVLLDIKGESISSVEFADLIDKTYINYPKVTFVIGGSNGVTENIKSIANKKISFSKMTFPHGLFRAILLEQIYRSCKINNNETYHK